MMSYTIHIFYTDGRLAGVAHMPTAQQAAKVIAEFSERRSDWLGGITILPGRVEYRPAGSAS